MASTSVDITQNASKIFQVSQATRKSGSRSESGPPSPNSSSSQIQKVSLVKLTPLDTTNGSNTSPLSPKTLTRLVEEQAESHKAIEALQQRIQATTPSSFVSDARKELEESAIKQRNVLNQIIGNPVPPSPTTESEHAKHTTMLDTSSDVMHSTLLAKKLFPIGSSDFDDDVIDDRQRTPGSENELWAKNFNRKGKRSDTDNDTGVESDTGSDPGSENSTIKSPYRDFFPVKKTTLSNCGAEIKRSGDELLVYLEMIEERALAVESLIEQAKLDTVLNIRNQIEAEFNGLSLEEIPAKCHQKIDRAIQRYLKTELEKIRAEYQKKETGSESSKPEGAFRATEGDLVRENEDLREKVGSLEMSVSRVDMLYLMQKKENEYLTEKVAKLERQLTSEKLKYETELDNVKQDYEEHINTQGVFSDKIDVSVNTKAQNSDCLHGILTEKLSRSEASQNSELKSLYRKLEHEEKQVKALRVAGEADQTTIRCLEEKANSLETDLKNSRQEVSDLLNDIRELQERGEKRERKLRERDAQLKEVYDERRVLRETLIMSEHEISLLENKLGNENNDAWRDSKKEILEDLRKLEKHIKVIHKEKRNLENKYLAFKIENEHLSDSLHSFSKTKDILTPLGSCNVSRQQSTLSSHSSSLSSSLAGSDVDDDEDVRLGSRSKVSHSSGRRRKRSAQDQKDQKFAEAVARKLMIAQQVLKDQNCNFSSFENSGEDLINEADQLVKRVDSLQAEKRAIKMELETIRSTAQPENVKC